HPVRVVHPVQLGREVVTRPEKLLAIFRRASVLSEPSAGARKFARRELTGVSLFGSSDCRSCRNDGENKRDADDHLADSPTGCPRISTGMLFRRLLLVPPSTWIALDADDASAFYSLNSTDGPATARRRQRLNGLATRNGVGTLRKHPPQRPPASVMGQAS